MTKLPSTEVTQGKARPDGGVGRLVVTQGPSTGTTLVLTRARALLRKRGLYDAGEP